MWVLCVKWRRVHQFRGGGRHFADGTQVPRTSRSALCQEIRPQQRRAAVCRRVQWVPEKSRRDVSNQATLIIVYIKKISTKNIILAWSDILIMPTLCGLPWSRYTALTDIVVWMSDHSLVVHCLYSVVKQCAWCDWVGLLILTRQNATFREVFGIRWPWALRFWTKKKCRNLVTPALRNVHANSFFLRLFIFPNKSLHKTNGRTDGRTSKIRDAT